MTKNLLLCVALMAAGSAFAEDTYNYFDAADVDADGWLWLDSDAKIDKYTGTTKDAKIQLLPCGYEDAQFIYAAPEAYPDIPGYNATGEEGGDGALYGAILLPQGSKPNTGTDVADGGAIAINVPDLVKFDLYVSSPLDALMFGLSMSNPDEEEVDAQVIRNYIKMGIWIKPFASVYQGEISNLQSLQNNVSGLSLPSEKGKPVKIYFRNNGNPLYIHGIRLLTYSPSNAGINDVLANDDSLVVVGNTVNCPSASEITVYNMAGMAVASVYGTSLDLSALQAGVYVASANGQSVKFVR